MKRRIHAIQYTPAAASRQPACETHLAPGCDFFCVEVERQESGWGAVWSAVTTEGRHRFPAHVRHENGVARDTAGRRTQRGPGRAKAEKRPMCGAYGLWSAGACSRFPKRRQAAALHNSATGAPHEERVPRMKGHVLLCAEARPICVYPQICHSPFCRKKSHTSHRQTITASVCPVGSTPSRPFRASQAASRGPKKANTSDA